MADPFTEYQKVLASRGLGGGNIFQEEGPGMGPSSKTISQIEALRQLRDGAVRTGMDERIATPEMNRGILDALQLEEREEMVPPRDIESAIEQLKGLGFYSENDTISRPGFSDVESGASARAAARIEAMPEDSSVFQSPMDAISAQIEKASLRPLVGSSRPDTQSIIAANKIEEAGDQENAQGIIVANPTDKDEDPVETAFVEGMNPYLDALNKKIPTANNREELLEKYKKEFSEATGIEIDGKVDKSQALMAMGLSLMQNRAGKGFNVGKLLNAVGQAGDKAMPYLREATKEAKAAQLASGKYALDKIAKGESATAAFNEEVRASADSWMLEKFKASNAIELEKIKAGGKANEMKNVASVPIGAGDLKVRIGDKNGVSVFASGPTDAGAIVNAYTKYTEGQENIDIMNDALSAIASKDSSALSTLSDRAKSVGVAWGIVDGVNMFGPKGVSDEAEFNKYRQATINAFKRLILQESQVSNLDLTTLFASFGDVKFMQNPKEAELAIELMNQYFASKKRSLEPVLTDFYDKSWFRSDEDYNRTQEKLSKINKVFDPKVTSEAGERMTLDLSTIPMLKSE